MIFKNRIKNKNLLEDIEKLNSRFDFLLKQVEGFQSTEKELRKILRNYVHGEVTGFSNKDEQCWPRCHFDYKAYVYKNGKEYIFDNLYIEKLNFSQGEKENIVYATSGDGTQKYVLDLFQNKAIEIEHRMGDNKNENNGGNMTIEQLNKANEVKNKIDTLKEFETNLDAGIISYVTYEMKPNSEKVELRIVHLDIHDHRNISNVIRKYVSERITELEKQLEEL